MHQNGRRDSSRTRISSLVAVLDRRTYECYIRYGKFASGPAVLLALNATAGLLNDLVREGCQVHFLCPPTGSGEPLQALREKAATTGLDFKLPAHLDDKSCVTLPDTNREIRAVLSRYRQIVVIGSDGMTIHVEPSEVVVRAHAPAGEPVAMTA